MRVSIELDDNEVKLLIIEKLRRELGDKFDSGNLSIKVMSIQNYQNKAWERGSIKVNYEGEI